MATFNELYEQVFGSVSAIKSQKRRRDALIEHYTDEFARTTELHQKKAIKAKAKVVKSPRSIELEQEIEVLSDKCQQLELELLKLDEELVAKMNEQKKLDVASTDSNVAVAGALQIQIALQRKSDQIQNVNRLYKADRDAINDAM